MATSSSSTSISLLKRLQNADTDSDWRRFICLYTPLILRWGEHRGLSRDDAADLVQEVMCKMITHLKTFDFKPDSSFRGWLRTVVQNQAIDMYRRRSARPAQSIDPSSTNLSVENPVDLFEAQEYSKYLVGRVAMLVKHEFADSTWQACWMSLAEGKSTKVIADHLELTENAVRVAKHRVLARLRVELRGLIDNV